MGARHVEVGSATEPKLPGLPFQLFAYLGGMVAYAVHLLAGTALVPFACDIGSTLPIHVLTAFALLVTAASGWASWMLIGRLRDRPGVIAERVAYLAWSGVFLNLVAGVTIIVAEIQVIALDPCTPALGTQTGMGMIPWGLAG